MYFCTSSIWRTFLIGLCAVILGACNFPGAPPPSPVIVEVTVVTTATTAPTSIPPTAVATVEPATATPAPSSPLVGPEWQVAFSGDINSDNIADVIAYKPSNITPIRFFSGPDYASYDRVASEIVIVQEVAGAQPQVLLRVAPQGITAITAPLAEYPAFDPVSAVAAFLIAVDPRGLVPLNIIPITGSGEPYLRGSDFFMQNDGIAWNSAEQAYRLVASDNLVYTARIVGPEWSVAASGDINRDGQADVIAYKPADVDLASPDSNYPLLASEVVITQVRPGGEPEIVFSITPAQIWAGSTTLLLYPQGSVEATPAAFALRVGRSAPGVLTFVAVNSAGTFIAQSFDVIWAEAEQAYRLVLHE
ncbi:MAG: hypothetical protein MI924_12060 [Chloroflexales bacterium]|nr:hypothetical protein [Chloroflexales bacterium]